MSAKWWKKIKYVIMFLVCLFEIIVHVIVCYFKHINNLTLSLFGTVMGQMNRNKY